MVGFFLVSPMRCRSDGNLASEKPRTFFHSWSTEKWINVKITSQEKSLYQYRFTKKLTDLLHYKQVKDMANRVWTLQKFRKNFHPTSRPKHKRHLGPDQVHLSVMAPFDDGTQHLWWLCCAIPCPRSGGGCSALKRAPVSWKKIKTLVQHHLYMYIYI